MNDVQARERLTGLWVEHRDAVAAFVYRRADADLVDDAVAETFLVAWRRLDDVPVDARPWLFAVARNVLSTQWRTQGRRRALDVRISLQPAAPADSAEDAAVESVSLVQAWRQLSDGEREVLALAAWEQLTSEQAARVLNCRRSTYTVRLSRARRHLRDLALHAFTVDQPIEASDALIPRSPQ